MVWGHAFLENFDMINSGAFWHAFLENFDMINSGAFWHAFLENFDMINSGAFWSPKTKLTNNFWLMAEMFGGGNWCIWGEASPLPPL